MTEPSCSINEMKKHIYKILLPPGKEGKRLTRCYSMADRNLRQFFLTPLGTSCDDYSTCRLTMVCCTIWECCTVYRYLSGQADATVLG